MKLTNKALGYITGMMLQARENFKKGKEGRADLVAYGEYLGDLQGARAIADIYGLNEFKVILFVRDISGEFYNWDEIAKRLVGMSVEEFEQIFK